MAMNALEFPRGFRWGAATSSHQVEGGQDNDWTAWERRGKIRDGSVSGRACDHWNRYEEDFDIARELGHNAHRLSLEWSRIEPRQGEWNEAALQHYRSVVRAVRQRGMEPFVTLWHFTNPRWFADRGGWEAGEAPALFSRYAAKAAEALPQVKFWLTVNEPNVYAVLGYIAGEWLPEVKNFVRAFRVHKQLIKGHQRAYLAMKQVRRDLEVGFAQNLVFFEPTRSSSRLDRWSTRQADRWYNRRFIALTRRHCDYLGVNHYLHQYIRFRSVRDPIGYEPQGQPQSDGGWQIYPQAMYQVLKIARDYGKPIYITENGVADAQDRWRKHFIRDYLMQVHRAMSEGADVRGYFHWSLLDNFEWREGFTQRFGLAEVDFQTQARKIRPSAHWFAEVCKRNALPLQDA